MPELRRDELTGHWVLIAPGRSARPHTFPPPSPVTDAPADCPFCPGHEDRTPPEVYRTGAGAPQTPGWRVRVVPNLYPVVGGPDAGAGATGEHEVAVLSPAHDRSFGQLADEQATELLLVLRDRSRFHHERGRIFVQTLINHGRAAGASIEHPHAQIVAVDVVPPAVQSTLTRLRVRGTDLIAAAAADADAGNDRAVRAGPVPVWCVEAGTTPFEFRAAYQGRAARFDEATDQEIALVAMATRDALARLLAVVGDVPYNLVIHTAPRNVSDPLFHWYLEVQTRVNVVAGFELGTGIFVNVTPPELAAKQLREAEVAQ